MTYALSVFHKPQQQRFDRGIMVMNRPEEGHGQKRTSC